MKGGNSLRKYSRQREAIRAYLKDRTDHPTAEQIFQGVREVQPEISRGTVYRNLNLLSGDGELLKLVCDDGVEHFDPTPQPHFHFYCTKCGAVLDVEEPAEGLFTQMPYELSCGRAEAYNVIFTGTCRNCIKAAVSGGA